MTGSNHILPRSLWLLCGELTEARGGGKSQNRPVSDTEMIRVRDDGILPQPIVLKGTLWTDEKEG